MSSIQLFLQKLPQLPTVSSDSTQITTGKAEGQTAVSIEQSTDLMSLIYQEQDSQIGSNGISSQPTLTAPNRSALQADVTQIAAKLQELQNNPELAANVSALLQLATEILGSLGNPQANANSQTTSASVTATSDNISQQTRGLLHQMIAKVNQSTATSTEPTTDTTITSSTTSNNQQEINPMSFYGPIISLLMLIINALELVREAYAKQQATAAEISLNSAQATASSIIASGQAEMTKEIVSSVTTGVMSIAGGVADIGFGIAESRSTSILNKANEELDSAKKQIAKDKQILADLDTKLKNDEHRIKNSDLDNGDEGRQLYEARTEHQERRHAPDERIQQKEGELPQLQEKIEQLSQKVKRYQHGARVATLAQAGGGMGGTLAASSFTIQKSVQDANTETTRAARDGANSIQNTVTEGYKSINDLTESMIQLIMSTNQATISNFTAISQRI